MAAAAVRGSMGAFDDSSSDEDERVVRRGRGGAAGHSLATAGASTSHARATTATTRTAGDVYAAAFAHDREDGPDGSKLHEAAFARATAAHVASLAAEDAAATSAVSGSSDVSRSSGSGASAAVSHGVAFADLDAHRKRLLLPAAPGSAPTQCTIKRTKSIFGHPIFRLYDEESRQFLMSAQKRSTSRTSNYLLAMEETPSRDSGNVVGKVRANWSGVLYTIFDGGMAPEDAVTDASLRQELAVVAFDWDAMGPGKMRAALPRLRKSGAPIQFRAREEDKSLAAAAASSDTSQILMLRNKRPKWDAAVDGHVLDFGGRVTMSSVKNFQLGSDEAGDDTLLQFGRTGKDQFTMDFRSPLSHVQAFGIVMSAIDGKIADRKALKKLTGRTPDEDDSAWFAHWRR